MPTITTPMQVIDAETGQVKEEKTMDWHLMPAPEGTCPECATAHEPHMPHNAQSPHYQYSFFAKHNRWPTWLDAINHCDDAMKELWTNALKEKGAQLLAQLRQIPKGMTLDVPAKELDDVMLPPQADPLVAMNAEEKAEWLHSRLPFPCDLTCNLEKDRWRFWHRDES